ncbi:MAG: hypothetical protein BWY57_02466 [Betaproteobacteria bacterium ADurb.Bin341]|nr:MAG: hypothetical protein BWY57_02466 [Betaproteobacteria bacterium ADurb.Bin341]
MTEALGDPAGDPGTEGESEQIASSRAQDMGDAAFASIEDRHADAPDQKVNADAHQSPAASEQKTRKQDKEVGQDDRNRADRDMDIGANGHQSGHQGSQNDHA